MNTRNYSVSQKRGSFGGTRRQHTRCPLTSFLDDGLIRAASAPAAVGLPPPRLPPPRLRARLRARLPPTRLPSWYGGRYHVLPPKTKMMYVIHKNQGCIPQAMALRAETPKQEVVNGRARVARKVILTPIPGSSRGRTTRARLQVQSFPKRRTAAAGK